MNRVLDALRIMERKDWIINSPIVFVLLLKHPNDLPICVCGGVDEMPKIKG